jgi:hypothetical protein
MQGFCRNLARLPAVTIARHAASHVSALKFLTGPISGKAHLAGAFLPEVPRPEKSVGGGGHNRPVKAVE